MGSPGVRGSAAVLAAFALLSLAHLHRLPVFEGPDEGDNLDYVRYLAVVGELPEPTLEEREDLELMGRAHMPPLWFASLVPLFRAVGADRWHDNAAVNPAFLRNPGVGGVAPPAGADEDDALRSLVLARLADPESRLHYRHGLDERSAWSGAVGAFRALRLTTVAWGVVALLLVWLVAREATGGDGARAAWIVALAAFTPQLQHLAATLTMDLALAAAGGLALWAACRWSAGGARAGRWALLAGVGAGLAAMVKLNGLVLWPVCAAAGLLARARGAPLVRPALAFLAALALVAGPWYLWGLVETGHPLWSWRYQTVSSFHNPEGGAGPAGVGLATGEGIGAFTLVLALTWLADFGWTSVWAPLWIVAPFFVVLAASVGAYVAGPVLGSRAERAPRIAGVALAAAGGAFVLVAWVPFAETFLGATRSATWSVALALAAVLGAALRARPVPEVRAGVARLLALGALAILGAEVWFNLHFVQPQARHLYPLLPALVVPIGLGLERLGLLRAAVVAHAVLSVAAFPMLLDRLRPEGWNADPRWSVTDAGRAPDPEVAPGGRAIAWREPEDGAALPLEGPAVLRWEAEPDAIHDVVLGVDDPTLEHRLWSRDGWVFRTLRDLQRSYPGELRLPESYWRAIPPGATLHVQVIEIGADGRAARRSPVLAVRRGE